MKRSAFTLIELLVVIAIIGIISTLSIVSFSTAREKARISSGLSFSSQMKHASGDATIGIWSFDECAGDTAYDASGFANDATLINAPTWSTDTPSGKGCSLYFDGVNQYAYSSDVLSRLTTNTITVSVWVKSATALWNTYGWPVSARANKFVFHVRQDVKTAQIYFGDGITMIGAPATSYEPSDITVWHHYAFSYNGTSLSYYVDGKLVQKNSGAGLQNLTLNYAGGPLYFGTDSLIGSGRYGNGWIDDVQVFDKALTASEISHIYAQGIGSQTIAVGE